MAANVIVAIFVGLGLLVCVTLFWFQMEREKEKAIEEVRRRQERQAEYRRHLIEARVGRIAEDFSARTARENLGGKAFAAPYGANKPKPKQSVTTQHSTSRVHQRDDDFEPVYPDYAIPLAAVLASTPEPVYSPSRDDSWTSCEPARSSREDSWTISSSSSYDSGSSDSGSSSPSSCD